MHIEGLGQIGSALAKARRASRSSDIDLRSIGSLQQAQDVQDAAVMGYGGVLRGYTLAATTALTARLLQCPKPIVGNLFDEHIHDTEGTLSIPYYFIGLGAQFLFMLGSPLAKPVTLEAVRNAVISCHLGIQLLGRRVPHGVPLNEWSATADFGLDVGCVRGPSIEDWDRIDLKDIEASLQLNGNVVGRGSGGHRQRPTASSSALRVREVSVRLTCLLLRSFDMSDAVLAPAPSRQLLRCRERGPDVVRRDVESIALGMRLAVFAPGLAGTANLWTRV